MLGPNTSGDWATLQMEIFSSRRSYRVDTTPTYTVHGSKEWTFIRPISEPRTEPEVLGTTYVHTFIRSIKKRHFEMQQYLVKEIDI